MSGFQNTKKDDAAKDSKSASGNDNSKKEEGKANQADSAPSTEKKSN